MNRRERTRLSAQLPSGREKEPTAVAPLHVQVPLKPQDKPTALPHNVTDVLQDEYAIKYLQRLGARPTSENIATVLSHLPLDECQIATAWKARGALADVVTIDLYPRTQQRVLSKTSTEAPSKPVTLHHGDSDKRVELNPHKAYRVGSVIMTFDDIKRQYLLPFKHGSKQEVDVLTTYGMKHEEPVVFVDIPALAAAYGAPSVHLLSRRTTQRRIKCVEERIIPPDAKSEQIQQMLQAFYGCLPLAMLGIRGDEEKDHVQGILLDPMMHELVTSMARFLYLDVFFKLACLGAADMIKSSAIQTFHKTAPAQIEALYVTLVRIFASIKSKREKEDKGVTLYLPLQLLALRVCVETMYRSQYPVSFNMTGPTMHYILMQMDAKITKLLDPEEHLSRIGALETTCESSIVMSSHPYLAKKRQMRLQDKFYQTSDALHAVFPNPVAGKCRKILKCRGGAYISSYPVVGPPEECLTPRGNQAQVSTREDNRTAPNTSIDTKLELLQILERTPKCTPLRARTATL
ncbi:hypothetical protein Poli38472_006538 [Pythium oligandrum]|uniref:Uncharacterized protein n=1 Tax=Pythium oligandrum TaxID=41045 RepID=A0A8K1C583_PYTOL|nr:hypothetical protein Poli38472_006538 [Pythium oligandrum]|eukprot:TMW56528.1 hypothetical protein Poli38472_006538 [Pythium oligandrum]